MYTRSFNDSDRLLIPDGYGGSALSRSEGLLDADEEQFNGFSPTEDETVSAHPKGIPGIGRFGSLFESFPTLLSRWGLKVPKIGVEELIIIAVAAFLLLSPEGDKECSIMLLLLLFVG